MKQLISADTVRQAQAEGKQRLEIVLSQCIVTPEARVVAERLGVELVEAAAIAAAPEVRGCAKPSVDKSDKLATIRQEVLARLPAGSVSAEVVDQLVAKMLAEQTAPAPTSTNAAGQETVVLPSGIKCVSGSSIKMGLFEGAGPDSQVGIADVITAADGSAMAAGFMQWENAFFPWTLNYDEINLILEGELHIRSNGQTVVAKTGDVLFIPKGSSIEFGTPSKVRFMYVAYPANWQQG